MLGSLGIDRNVIIGHGWRGVEFDPPRYGVEIRAFEPRPLNGHRGNVLFAQVALEADEIASVKVVPLERGHDHVPGTDVGQLLQCLLDSQRVTRADAVVLDGGCGLTLKGERKGAADEHVGRGGIAVVIRVVTAIHVAGTIQVHPQFLRLSVTQNGVVRVGHQDVHVGRKHTRGQSLRPRISNVTPQLKRLADRDGVVLQRNAVQVCRSQTILHHIAGAGLAFASVDRVDDPQRVDGRQRPVAGHVHQVGNLRLRRCRLGRVQQLAAPALVHRVDDDQRVPGVDAEVVGDILRPETVMERVGTQHCPRF